MCPQTRKFSHNHKSQEKHTVRYVEYEWKNHALFKSQLVGSYWNMIHTTDVDLTNGSTPSDLNDNATLSSSLLVSCGTIDRSIVTEAILLASLSAV